MFAIRHSFVHRVISSSILFTFFHTFLLHDSHHSHLKIIYNESNWCSVFQTSEQLKRAIKVSIYK